MSGWAVFLIIALVLGIIVSNILLVKYTANMKMPDVRDPMASHKKTSNQASENEEDETKD
ncbi:MAG: Protein of unknown function (DUF2897) [Idiomarinaceae bacterium HL-53]|nr:MAG: Protein of unknown function (DUF2897) [Idiomarinaceae bacterium HL-53]CUS49229.1 Protein of unknown function (DUF2897) [Idiomarinaceae bacterium HL-53]